MAVALTRSALFRSLKHRSFVLLWTGQTLSRVGDYLYQIALTWFVLEETGSAAAVAGVLIFSFTPMLVFLLIGGVAVDRFSRVRVMLASDVLRGAAVILVAVLAFGDRLELGHLYAISLVFGLIDAFFQPAYSAMVPELVPDDDLPSANSLSSWSVQLGRVVGPPLGAAIVALGGTDVAFAVNGTTFFVSAAFLLPLLRVHPAAATGTGDDPGASSGDGRPSVLADLREGLSTVARSRWLWLTILLYALVNVTLAGPYSVALPFLVEDHLHADVGTLGLLYAVFPIGYVIGGAWLGRRDRLRRRGVTAYGGAIVAGLTLLMFGLPVPVLVLAAAALVNGAALEMGNLAWVSTLQDPAFVPRAQLGRVSSIDMLGSFVLLPVGYALAGWSTDNLGPANTFLIGGGVTAVVGLALLTNPDVRSVD